MVSSNVLKILLVLEMLKKTDEKNPINSTQIIEELKKCGLQAERKSIGNYIRVLTDEMNYEIFRCENKNLGWYMTSQDFEEYELKMLVDAVNASQFITAKETRILRDKLLNLASKEGKRVISSGMVTEDSLKLVDAQFAVKFDSVMRAIADKKKIQFRYQELGPGNEKITKKNGKIYTISPYYLGVWGHEYFVMANTDGHNQVSFYRVEMMKDVVITDQKSRAMSEVEQLKDIGKKGRTFGDFIKETINLRSGHVRSVKISGINPMQREVIKKFGKDILFKPSEEGRFEVNIEVVDSEGFYQWIAQYGTLMKIEAPEETVAGFKAFLSKTMAQYFEK